MKYFSPVWVRWLFQTYVGLAVMTLGCVLMTVDALEDFGAYVAVGGVIWFGVSYWMRPFLLYSDDDTE